MEHYLLVARSITHAQQMMKTLEQAGIPVRVRRAGHTLTGRGCGYTLDIAAKQYSAAILRLQQSQQTPIKVFKVENGRKVEVSL